ncbi:MAG: SDR family oxidoreductase [Gammaproteobacteria bacterium]|nr:SDR family oxidoreductase [Gammaproteobacteria bacterium]
MADRMRDMRVLVTQADDFMGPPTVEIFKAEGATVIADTRDLTDVPASAAAIADAGHVDVLIANLAAPTFTGIPATELGEDDWQTAFDMMVHPLHRLTKAVLPQMLQRERGKIVVYGSASAMKGMRTLAAYSAARAAQIGYVQSVGVEVAAANVQINLIAQNYVESKEYYPPELMQKESFMKSLRRQVPAGRLGTAREDVLFALFLASGESDFFVGQAFPFSGGWVQ